MANSVLQHLFPNGNFILGHLHHSADRVHSLGLILYNVVHEKSTDKRKELLDHSARLHKETLAESRLLFETLSKNLITPFDREDIFAIGSGLKSISSKTDSLIRFIEQNKCNSENTGLKELTLSFTQASAAMTQVVQGLEHVQQYKKTYGSILDMKEQIVHINEICERSMIHCFDEIESIKLILINIDLYIYFDTLSEKLKELAQVAEGFIVKYA